jgi:hypothetical protein
MKREGTEPVYNIEVECDHVYRVGEQGILAHNTSAKAPVTEADCYCPDADSVSKYVTGPGGRFTVQADVDTTTVSR